MIKTVNSPDRTHRKFSIRSAVNGILRKLRRDCAPILASTAENLTVAQIVAKTKQAAFIDDIACRHENPAGDGIPRTAMHMPNFAWRKSVRNGHLGATGGGTVEMYGFALRVAEIFTEYQ